MALVAPPANDRKRVKVYELKNNDWFDRGTGFCRGIVVSAIPSSWPSSGVHGRRGALASWCAMSALCLADLCDHRPTRRKSSSYPRTTRRDNCSRRAYPKTTATRNSKVLRASFEAPWRQLTGNRHLDSMDRAKWHRHGPQLPRARGLRQHMVRGPAYALTSNTLMQDRDFVNEVQSRLQALAQGRLNPMLRRDRSRLTPHR
jgi:hypothetical protein